MRSKFVLGALCASALCGAAHSAHANGRFPEANQVVFNPVDPQHLLVRTTFGLLESRDRAMSFNWTCETALDVSGETDPMLAITAGGAQIAATFTGIRRSADGCSYQSPPELAGQIVPDLTLDASSPHRVLAFRTLSLGGGRFESALVRSEDDGQTWAALEPPLPSEVLPLSVDIAPSQSARIYLSARLDADSLYASVLLRSDDGGQTFEQFAIPETEHQKLAFIAAVDPEDADRVFVRIDDPLGTRVLSSADAGQSFRELFRGNARLPGFAIKKDASEIAIGGPSDGLWVGAPDGAGLEHRSTVAPSCLGYGPDGLYACSDATQLGTLLLRSRDGGTSFETLLTFDSLCGSTCAASTDSARVCRAEWQLIAPTLGTTCGTTPVGKPLLGEPSYRAAGGGCALANGSRESSETEHSVILLALIAGLRRARRFAQRASAKFATSFGNVSRRRAVPPALEALPTQE